jgi:hypothetical protein
MTSVQKKILNLSIPITLGIIFFGIVRRFFRRKPEIIPEKVKSFTQNAMKDIENTVGELKEAIENKNANQLEKSIDAAVENAKRSIDKIGSHIKSQLQNYEIHDTLPKNIQAS